MTLGSRVHPRALRSAHYGYVVAALGLLALLGAQGLGRFAYPLLLPAMRDALELSYAQTGLLAGVNSGGYLVVSVFAGFVAARHGPRRVVSVALAMTGVAMFFLAIAPTFLVALLAQFSVGVAMAFVTVPVMGMCSAWFAPSRRGLAAGIVAAGSGMGLIVTGAVVPLIYVAHGVDWWRFAWGYFGLAVFALTLLTALLLRDRPRPGQARVGETAPAPPPAVAVKPSLFTPAVMRHPLVWYLSLLSGINTFAYVGFATFFAAYLMNERGVDPATTGALWSAAGLAALFSGLVWGVLSDRAGRKLAVALIFVVQIACFTIFTFSPSVLGYLVAALLYGLIARANFAVSAAACGDIVGPALAPAAFGINAIGAAIGLVIGPVVAGPL
ncbi:MAG: MFS transporter, partial [Chloroflexi bacterium]|nr:MFS transporter [Chloroflexota bacterium]